jgi:hypothetical protein
MFRKLQNGVGIIISQAYLFEKFIETVNDLSKFCQVIVGLHVVADRLHGKDDLWPNLRMTKKNQFKILYSVQKNFNLVVEL